MFTKTKFTRFVGVAAAAVCMVSGLNFAPVAIDIEAADVMTAFEITENMQFGWNLGNTFDSYVAEREYDDNGKEISCQYPKNLGLETETAWGNPVTTREMIHAVKAKGFSTIRIPTTWFQHVDESNNYKIDEAWMARVKEVVDWSIEEGLYVILNMHHEETWQNNGTLGSDYNRIKPFVTSVWSQIAETFKDYDQHLVFEAMNEPRAVGTSYEWWAASAPKAECDTINKLNADVVNVIRSTKSQWNDVRLIMLPSYCASSDPTFMNENVIPAGDSYLAASVHAYSPYNFTMNNAVEDHSSFTGAYKNELVNCLDTVKTTFIDKKIPVVIGEMSASNYHNIDARTAWAKTYAETVKAAGIPCVLWDNNVVDDPKNQGESHGYLDRKNCSWYPQSEALIDTFLTVLNDASTEWGKAPEKAPVNHDDISTGTVLFNGPKELDKDWGNDAHNWADSVAINLTSFDSQLAGKDVAVKLSGGGDVVAAVSDAEWGGWSEIKPYDVDKEKGIAYFSMADLLDAWGDDSKNIAHLSIKTTNHTTVDTVAAIKAAERESSSTDVKKIGIKLKDRKDGEILVVTFKAAAGSAIEGCVGYPDAAAADGWSQVEFKGKVGADGTYTVEVPNIPAAAERAEAQIWWCDDSNCTVSSSFKAAGSEQPTEPATPAPTEPATPAPTEPATPAPTEPATSAPTIPVTPGVTAKLYGDANCDGNVTIADCTIILQSMGNPDVYKLSDQGAANADCCDTGNGVTGLDALVIMKVDAGLLNAAELPVKSS